MPFEIMVVIIVSIVAGMLGLVTITKMIVGAVERRRLGDMPDNSMTRGELERLIDEAIRNAIAPLEEKVDVLQQLLPPADEPPLLESHHRSSSDASD